MATIYVRDVPDDVTAALRRRAAAEGKSLSGYVAAELAVLAARPTTEEVVARLRERDRTTGPTRDEVVDAVRAGRR